MVNCFIGTCRGKDLFTLHLSGECADYRAITHIIVQHAAYLIPIQHLSHKHQVFGRVGGEIVVIVAGKADINSVKIIILFSVTEKP